MWGDFTRDLLGRNEPTGPAQMCVPATHYMARARLEHLEPPRENDPKRLTPFPIDPRGLLL
jgi:hypothetical protein